MNLEVVFRLMDNKIDMLLRKNHEMTLLGEEYAKSQRKYKKEQAKKIFLLRSEKAPATIIGDLSRGDEVVVDLRFKRNLAKIIFIRLFK